MDGAGFAATAWASSARRSPTSSGRQTLRTRWSRAAFKAISGPMPAGSPMLIATFCKDMRAGSDRDGIGAELAKETVLGAFGEFDALGQLDRAGAHALRFRGQAGDFLSLAVGFDRAQQGAPRHDDAIVRRDQILLTALDDRPHAFLERCILHADAIDAAIGNTRDLRVAIHQVVVALVGERIERTRDRFHMNARAVVHRRDFLARERAAWMIIDAPRPGVVVVDRNPGVTADRVATARRNQRVERHDPGRDAPIIMVGLGVAPRRDEQAALEFGDVEDRHAVAGVVLVAFAALEQGIALERPFVQE